MRTIKSLFFALVAIVVALTTSCSGNKKSQEAAAAYSIQVAPVVMTVDQILANLDSLVGKDVTVEGVCSHVCQHGGKKLFLMGNADSLTMQVNANAEIGKFNPDVVNNLVQVTGTLQENRIDEAYLVAWEERVKAANEEKHGETEAGCETEKKARGESAASKTTEERIADFRARIAKREAEEGKAYLSTYSILASSYEIK